MNNIITSFSDSVNTRLIKDQSVYLRSFRKKEHFLISLNIFGSNLEKYDISKKEFENVFGSKSFEKSLIDCGSWIEWDYYLKSQKIKLQNANFCKKDKLCPACAVRRSYKQHIKFLQSLEDDGDLIDQDWYYIVIPVKHSIEDSFEDVFNRIVDIRSKIVKALKNKRQGKKVGFWGNFNGGMTSIETTKTNNGWNVHLNLILNASKGTNISIKKIRNKRGQISNQNIDLVDFLMRVADSKMHNIQKLDFSSKDSIREALVEVLKYSLKFSSLSDNDLIYIYVKTYKKRLFTTFGNLRGLDIENVPLEGDIIPSEDFLHIMYRRIDYDYKLHSVRYEKKS